MIVTARKLARASPKKPRQSDLRRAISTAYYALFHAVAKDIADRLVGVGANRPNKAWSQAYRGIQHNEAKSRCKEIRNMNFPAGIKRCADAFVDLQELRHSADYDPDYRVLRGDALAAVAKAESAIADLHSSPIKDRTAFAIYLLLKKRP